MKTADIEKQTENLEIDASIESKEEEKDDLPKIEVNNELSKEAMDELVYILKLEF